MSFKIHGFSNTYNIYYDYCIFVAHKYNFISYHTIFMFLQYNNSVDNS